MSGACKTRNAWLHRLANRIVACFFWCAAQWPSADAWRVAIEQRHVARGATETALVMYVEDQGGPWRIDGGGAALRFRAWRN